MAFLHKSVGEEDALFGSDLRDLRELHAISFEQACHETKIDARVLRALEEDRLQDLDDPLFVRRHLMAYVRYLGGHEPYFEARFDRMMKELQLQRQTEDLLPRTRRVRFFDLFVAPQFIAFFGVIILALLLGGYVLWQAYAVNTSPELTVHSPQDGERVERPRVLVEGQTIPEAYVTINDRDAAVDEEGRFRTELDVPRGTTAIITVARRRRGSETTVVRHVLYDRDVMDVPSALDLVATSTEAVATGTDVGL